jgi:hypothetical protein
MKSFPFDVENLHAILKKKKIENFQWPVFSYELENISNKLNFLYIKHTQNLNNNEKLIINSDFQFIYYLIQHINSKLVIRRIKKNYNTKHLLNGDSYKYYFPKKNLSLLLFKNSNKNLTKNLIKDFIFNKNKFFNQKNKYFYIGSASTFISDFVNQNNLFVKNVTPNFFNLHETNLSNNLINFVKNYIYSIDNYLVKKFNIKIDDNFFIKIFCQRLIKISNIFYSIEKNTYKNFKGVIVGNIMNPLSRAVLGGFKNINKSAITFDHGTGINSYNDVVNAIFLLNSTHHVCYNEVSKKNLKLIIKKSRFANLLSYTKIIKNKNNYHSQFFEKKNQLFRKKNLKKLRVLIMGFPMGSLIYPGAPGYNYFNKINLEINLAKFLKFQSCEVIYKIHPERVNPTLNIIKKYVDEVITENFENLDYKKFDLIIHTYTRGSTFMYTISKNYNIILLDEDLRKSEEKFKKFLKKRCYILKTYSKDNFTKFNEKSLLNIIKKFKTDNLSLKKNIVKKYLK